VEKPSSLPADKPDNEPADSFGFRSRLIRWGIVLFVAVGILLIPVPAGITPESWRLLAIFAATITGSIVRPIPGAAMVLLGVTALPVFNVMTINEALTGYADPVRVASAGRFLHFARHDQDGTGTPHRFSFYQSHRQTLARTRLRARFY
jgi:hypothetical protein